MLKRVIKMFFLASVSFFACSFGSNVDGNTTSFSDETGHASISSMEVVENDLESFPSCFRYRIEALLFKVYYNKFGIPFFYWTLEVSHYSPDYNFMTHYQLNDIPMSELNVLVGDAYKEATDILFKKGISLVMPQAGQAGEIGGARYKKENYGKHFAPNLYESTVIGSPSSVILSLFSLDGFDEDDILDDIDDIENAGSGLSVPISASNFLSLWQSGEFLNALGMASALKAIVAHPTTVRLTALVAEVVALAVSFESMTGGMPVLLGGSIFCPNHDAPFQPMYLSGLDAIQWRTGFPVTDPDYADRIVNPFSFDRVGGNFVIPPLNIETFHTFGHLYPREGTVNHQQTTKASMLVTERAENILSTQDDYRVILTSQYQGGGDWARNFPVYHSCEDNIAYTSLVEHLQAKHIWTKWPRYQCHLKTRGSVIQRIPLNIDMPF